MKVRFAGHIYEKYPNIKFYEKIRPVGAELFHADGWMDGWMDGRMDGRTDRHEKANSRSL
jgi:hypothetical protein